MTDAPVIEPLVIARLQAKVPNARWVKGSVDFAAAQGEGVTQGNCLFVMLSSTQYTANQFGTQICSQRCTEQFGVISVVKSARTVAGADSADLLQALRGPVFNALHGFVLTPDCDPIEAGPGKVLDFKNGALWWLDMFLTRYEIRSGVSES